MSSNYSGSLRTPLPDVYPTPSIQKPHRRRKPPPQRKTKKNTRSQYHREPPSDRRSTLPSRSQADPQKTSQKDLLHQLLPIGTLEERLSFLPMPHCHLHQPHHEEHLCLLKSLGPYGRPKTPIKQESPSPPPLPIRIPYQRGFKNRKPASPLTSPTTSSSSNGGIKKNKGKGKKKNHYTREQRKAEKEIDQAFNEIEREWERKMEEFSQQQNEPYDYDDEALNNINEEPSGF